MTINEETGEEPSCPICGQSDEDWGCGHVVAIIDETYADCYGGELYDRVDEFREMIEDAFLRHLKKGSTPVIQSPELQSIWDEAKDNFEPDENSISDEDAFAWDEYAFINFLAEILEASGAMPLPGSWVDEYAPGSTSAYTFLFAENPGKVVNAAIKKLSETMTAVGP